MSVCLSVAASTSLVTIVLNAKAPSSTSSRSFSFLFAIEYCHCSALVLRDIHVIHRIAQVRTYAILPMVGSRYVGIFLPFKQHLLCFDFEYNCSTKGGLL